MFIVVENIKVSAKYFDVDYKTNVVALYKNIEERQHVKRIAPMLGAEYWEGYKLCWLNIPIQKIKNMAQVLQFAQEIY